MKWHNISTCITGSLWDVKELTKHLEHALAHGKQHGNIKLLLQVAMIALGFMIKQKGKIKSQQPQVELWKVEGFFRHPRL